MFLGGRIAILSFKNSSGLSAIFLKSISKTERSETGSAPSGVSGKVERSGSGAGVSRTISSRITPKERKKMTNPAKIRAGVRMDK